jgi:hypothetical protein
VKIRCYSFVRRIAAPLFVCALWANAGCAVEGAKNLVLPPDAKVTGSVDTSGGTVLATGTGKDMWRAGAAWVEGSIPAATPVMVVQGKIGKQDTGWLHFTVELKDAEGRKSLLNLRTGSTSAELPDDYIGLIAAGGKNRYHVRPNPIFYSAGGWKAIKDDWFKTPGASEHTFTLELCPTNGQTQIFLDHQYLQSFSTSQPFVSYKISLVPGNELKSLRFAAPPPDTSLVALPIAAFPRTEDMPDAKLEFANNAALPAGFQKPASGPAGGIAVTGLGSLSGLARVNGLPGGRFWERGALEGLEGQRIFTVPLATYSEASVLCAVDDVPEKVNSFTLRVTRYGKSRGDAMADTTVTVPASDAKDTASARRVGAVSYGATGARKKATLWLLKVPIKSGLVQDLLYDGSGQSKNMASWEYLDVELLDPLRNVEADEVFPPAMTPTGRVFSPENGRVTRSRNPKENIRKYSGPIPRSAVHIFGLALHRSPAALEVRANTDFQVFYKSDNPAWLARVRAREAGTYTVQWDFADVEGKIVTSGKRPVMLAAGKDQTVTVPITENNGWYATRFQLLDNAGGVLLDHRGSFVVLPPDTRKAGFESPFGTWWFHWAHGGEPNIERVGPLLQRAGLRHTKLPESLPESLTKKYGVTEWEVPWLNSKKPTLAEHEAFIAKYRELWPSVNKMLIWHESGTLGAAFPSEMWGQKPPAPSAKVDADWKDRIEYATALARMVRAKYPDLELKYGNHLDSLEIVAGLLRRHYPRQLIDTIAIENLGQTFLPESADIGGVQAAWYLRETARQLGYGDVPVTATSEWINRRDRALGLKTQAEWYVRDALQALAYGFDTIALGSIHDAGEGYYYSAWGAGGLTGRYPLMQPKPAYAAFATLTRVLDSAKFQRAFPTGSHSLYALEFRRGHQWIYALWTPRGERPVTVKFPDAGPRAVTDIYGRESTPATAQFDLKVSTAAQYIVSDSQLTSVAPRASTFPDDKVPASPIVVDAMNKTENWSIAPEPDAALEKNGAVSLPRYTKGNFVMRQVADAKKGDCLEVELKPQGELWAGTQEYAVLDLKKPVAAGDHDFIGMWVKGSSSPGNVKFRLKRPGSSDTWLALSKWYDWPGADTTNYDGWNFLRMALPPGEGWQVTGVAVTVPRQTLYLTEMVPAQSLQVRLKGLCVFN